MELQTRGRWCSAKASMLPKGLVLSPYLHHNKTTRTCLDGNLCDFLHEGGAACPGGIAPCQLDLHGQQGRAL